MRFPYRMMLILFKSNAKGVTSRRGTAYPSGTPEFPRFLMGLALLKFSVKYFVDHYFFLVIVLADPLLYMAFDYHHLHIFSFSFLI